MRTLVLSALASTLAVAAPGMNFSGKWDLQIRGPRGQMQQTILVLNQVGDEVTGNVLTPRENSGSPASTQVYAGKVEGDTISFYMWAGRDQMTKVTYKGALSGEQILLIVTGSPVNYDFRGEAIAPSGPEKVIAKRVK
jgi:hypothetical protein